MVSTCPILPTTTDTLQPFQIEPLDTPVNFDEALASPQWVTGAGQKIFWSKCAVTVYEKGDRTTPTERYNVCTGKGTVERGIELWLTGQGGRVKK